MQTKFTIPAGFYLFNDGKAGDGTQYRHKTLPLAICTDDEGNGAELFEIKGDELSFIKSLTKPTEFRINLPEYDDCIPMQEQDGVFTLQDAPYDMITKIGSQKAHSVIDEIILQLGAGQTNGTAHSVIWTRLDNDVTNKNKPSIDDLAAEFLRLKQKHDPLELDRSELIADACDNLAFKAGSADLPLLDAAWEKYEADLEMESTDDDTRANSPRR